MSNPIFQSATRVTLLVLVVVLSAITVYGAWSFEDKRFELVFTTFSNLIIATSSFFFGKSSQETTQPKEPQDELLDALKQ